MQKEQALRILNALANGVHPATGEKFAADSPYQHPDTVRALFEAMRAAFLYSAGRLTSTICRSLFSSIRLDNSSIGI